MTSTEFAVLEGLSTAKGAATAHELAADPYEKVGYILRALETRGWVEHAGRRHGGAWKWQLTDRGRALVNG